MITGTNALAATSLAATLLSRHESDSAVRPLNAATHIAYGREAEHVDDVDLKHTALGIAINIGASVFWATLFEKAFGRTADRGDVAKAAFGAKAVADLAYLTDYHVLPRRLSPGWEAGVSERSVLVLFNVLAASLPVRGLLRRLMRDRSLL